MVRKLTVAQVKEIAMANYANGGDAIIECWEDEEIAAWLAEGNGRRALAQEMKLRASYFEDLASEYFGKGDEEEMEEKLTVLQVKEIAVENYDNGGDAILEDWTDAELEVWLAAGNGRTELMAQMREYYVATMERLEDSFIARNL